MRKISLSLILGILLISGCARDYYPSPTPDQPIETEPAVSDLRPAGNLPTFSLFYIPSIDLEFERLLQVFTDYPYFRATLIFPPRYFEKQSILPEKIAEFQRLLKTNQIEIGLSLDKEPMLPLIGDLNLAIANLGDWEFTFSWPEDIAGHLAKGITQYQDRWEGTPKGFLPPYWGLSDEVVNNLRRFHMRWVLAEPRKEYGAQFFGKLAVLAPPLIVVETQADERTPEWMANYILTLLDYPFALVDGSYWERPQNEIAFLEAIAEKTTWKDSKYSLQLGDELVAAMPKDLILPEEGQNYFTKDFERWVRTDRQRLAWKALSETREVIRDYKNSGRANVKRLDTALEEMYTAESGPFLLALGQTRVSLSVNERSFLATLANVYRLTGKPIPDQLNQWFELGGGRITAELRPKNESPFFQKSENTYIWSDNLGDDDGDGTFTYPTGDVPSGLFDLRSVSLTWSASRVTFSIQMGKLVSEKESQVLPLVDIYIDVNQISGAGADDPLAGREPAKINRDAAWEYAVAASPKNVVLYQSVPGQAPRHVADATPVFSGSREFEFHLDRKLLRGDPSRWRLTVGVMGTDGQSWQKDFRPTPIRSTSGQKNFGGAVPGRTPAPFIDLLTGSSSEQVKTIRAYQSTGRITLPFVEPE